MNNLRRNISIALIAHYAVTLGSWLFYSQSQTFWNKDLETSFPSSTWLIIVLALTVLVLLIAYSLSKTIVKKAGLPVWTVIVATTALATPALNLITGFTFARLNGVDNVHGFPLNRLNDLFADQVLFFMAGAVVGFGILVASRFVWWIVGKFSLQAQLP
jgi:hypothetical protein